jgi:hypothetical protein
MANSNGIVHLWSVTSVLAGSRLPEKDKALKNEEKVKIFY